MAKIDPGMCPNCGNPICHVISITCVNECVLFESRECYQQDRNTYGSCRCDFDVIMEAFGKDWSCNGLNQNQKSAEIKNYLFRLFQGVLSALPDDLFEI